jgi:UDP-N-acetylmuramate--alanine ligase
MQNVANATGALALALELGADFQAISEALVEFHGVDRRFTKIEAPDGYLIIDDYGHHPTEIRVTVESARRLADERGGRLIAVFQPHRYSRTESFFGQFASSFEQVDELIVTEIYSSGEEPIAGISGERLSAEIASKITGKTAFIADFSEIKNLIGKITKKNDMVLLVGAGTVTKLVNLLTTTHR